MTINAGIWIDHHKAVVVFISHKGEETVQITSDHDVSIRSRKGARVKNSYTPNDFVAEDKRERKEMIQFNKYYDEVIACVRRADSIFILGPGEAKGELFKRLQRKALKGRPARVETADKMTEPQIAARVRRHFSSPRARKQPGLAQNIEKAPSRLLSRRLGRTRKRPKSTSRFG